MTGGGVTDGGETGGGTVIAGRYRLVHRLAAGGMGTVWEGWDELLQRPVAVKALHPQPGLSEIDRDLATQRAMREGRLTARLHHPHAVPVYDVVDDGGRPCLIMQFLPSISLQELVTQKGTLELSTVARIGAEVASALAAAHAAGIVHRDVKPGNVLIAEDGSAKITDFGISHALDDITLTSTGMVTGTPAYLAPEVARGVDSGFAADVFSLGSTLYLAVAGTPPFGTDSNPMAMLHKVASGRISHPLGAGPVTSLIMRMLEADPARRPPMVDVARDLAGAAASMAPESAGTTQPIDSAAALSDAITSVFAPVGQPHPHSPPTGSASAGRLGVAAPEHVRRRRLNPIAALAALLAAGLVAVLAALLIGQNGGDPHAKSSTAGATSPTSASASKSQSAAAPTAQQLAQAVRDYYGLVPGDTGQSWVRLTTRYQQGHAGGRQSYDSFWNQIRRVTVAGATGHPPANATATLTYVYKNGTVIDEQTSFVLVRQNGTFKIDDTTVVSSHTR